MADLSRRALVGALPAVAASAIPNATAKSAAASDPIYAAIAAQQVTWDAFGATLDAADNVVAKLEGRVVTPAETAAMQAAMHADQEALNRIAATAPTTLAGMFAAFHLLQERGSGDQRFAMIETVLASPLAGGAHG